MDREPSAIRYGSVLVLLYGLLMFDLAINAAAPMLYKFNTVQLVIYVLQDTCIVMGLIILFLTFFSTYVFQAGLIAVLVRKFRNTIGCICVYLALSIALHIWSLRRQWAKPYDLIWDAGLTTLYVIQRLAGVLYYHLYKRTVLLLGDQRYYQDSPWLRAELEKRR